MYSMNYTQTIFVSLFGSFFEQISRQNLLHNTTIFTWYSGVVNLFYQMNRIRIPSTLVFLTFFLTRRVPTQK